MFYDQARFWQLLTLPASYDSCVLVLITLQRIWIQIWNNI